MYVDILNHSKDETLIRKKSEPINLLSVNYFPPFIEKLKLTYLHSCNIALPLCASKYQFAFKHWEKSLKESVCVIIDNSIVSRQDVLHRPSVNQMTFPVSIIIRQKIYILLANIRHRQVFSPHHRMFVRGKIRIKFGTDASPVTRLIGQVFFLNLSDHYRQLFSVSLRVRWRRSRSW